MSELMYYIYIYIYMLSHLYLFTTFCQIFDYTVLDRNADYDYQYPGKFDLPLVLGSLHKSTLLVAN